jgi:hypothetical protein
MHLLHPELTAALAAMLQKLHAYLHDGGYSGPPIRMFLAGGMAVHFHCGTRYTEDVDASFSARVLFPTEDLTVDYIRQDGTPSALYFDANYNDGFALMHPDYRDDSVPWQGIGNEDRLVHLYVLNPVDLAVSKISRFGEQDRSDIRALARAGYFNSNQLRQRATEALDYYVGNLDYVRTSIQLICEELDE